MIKEALSFDDKDIELLKKTWRGMRIYSYYKAYGIGYDFCRFYRYEHSGGGKGIILIINATMEGYFTGSVDPEEIAWFITLNVPFRVQISGYVVEMLKNYMGEGKILGNDYRHLRRTMFEISDQTPSENFRESDVEMNPSLDDVYKILSEGFPNILDYPLWLTDTSHRCRHGVSHIMTYKNATTATIMFDIDDNVLVGEVATSAESRGLGYARDYLKWLGGFLRKFHKRAVLYALDIRVSFYREIGFREIEHEYVLERIEAEKDDFTKGELETNV